MKPAAFDYRAPESLDEALALLASNPEEKVLAGISFEPTSVGSAPTDAKRSRRSGAASALVVASFDLWTIAGESPAGPSRPTQSRSVTLR